MIDHESLPLWMTTIKPGLVGPEIREKIEQYQLEAKKVLADHFLGTKSKYYEDIPVPDPSDEMSNVLLNLYRNRCHVLEVKKQQEAQWAAIQDVKLVALEADSKAEDARHKAQASLDTINNRYTDFDIKKGVGHGRLFQR